MSWTETDRSDSPPRSQNLTLNQERIIVLHDMISKTLGIKVIQQEQPTQEVPENLYYHATKIRPFLKHLGRTQSLVSRQVLTGEKNEVVLSSDEAKQTFSFRAFNEVTHVTFQLKEPMCLVWSISLQLEQDEYFITYPCTKLRIFLT